VTGPTPEPLALADGSVAIHRLDRIASEAGADLARFPHTVRVLLENLVRAGGPDGARDAVALAAGAPDAPREQPFAPGRVLMQDFTGVPAVVDLAAMRSAVAREGGDPDRVNPQVPVDLIIDHSVQVDRFASREAYGINLDFEYRRNGERYAMLRWAQQAFRHFRVVPPGAGICHQVNLEHLASVVRLVDGVAFPDTLVGTDSHTTMVNGLGVLGWGVGGIEAEAAMLGQPMVIPRPVVVGVRLTGALPAGTTATDLVLTITQMLREQGVVGRFVEFFGAGLSSLEVADRATISNMCPEYGATASLFPVDHMSLRYLELTGRDRLLDLVERYTKEQGLFRTDADPDPVFDETLELDLSTVEASLAGPRRPQDRVALRDVPRSFTDGFADRIGDAGTVGGAAESGALGHGSVVIAAVTSCTNTSNPTVMVAAALLAKKAVDAGLQRRPWVKTSMAPGSRVVTDYLDRAGLTPYLEKLGFDVVGFGCTTCIGNSGPLPDDVAAEVDGRDLVVAAVLSGNRNFEGRIHPQVRASYLASPPLCVAYALAGRVDLDLSSDPLGTGHRGPVHLRDVWPTADEVREIVGASMSAEQFDEEYGRVFGGDERWAALPSPEGPIFRWDPGSTYVREPPFFDGIASEPAAGGDIDDARALVVVGGSVTTDHISPAGSIKADSPAGRYLQEHGVAPSDFNSYGARRGNHEVMVRGTFANIRLRNRLVEGTEGPWTVHLPDGERMFVYDAAMRYVEEGVPLIVLAGREYGSGSSRDWAAKGPALLGVRAVIAESFERIHRSNLVGMGVLPLQFEEGQSVDALGLTGRELFAIRGLADGIEPGQRVAVEAVREDGTTVTLGATARIDGPADLEQYVAGGVLPMVARRLVAAR